MDVFAITSTNQTVALVCVTSDLSIILQFYSFDDKKNPGRIILIEHREVPAKNSPIGQNDIINDVRYLDEFRVIIASTAGLFINKNNKNTG